MGVKGAGESQVAFRRSPPFVTFTDQFWAALDAGLERHYRAYRVATILLWSLGAALAVGDVLTTWALLERGFVERNPVGRLLLHTVGGIAFLPAKVVLLGFAFALWSRLPDGLDVGVPFGVVVGNALPFLNNAFLLAFVA